MAENKTKPTDASVEDYIVARGSPLTGFAIRGRDLVIYLVAEHDEQKSLLSRLGPHRMGKSCLYFKQLADLDRSALQQLVTVSIANMKRRYR